MLTPWGADRRYQSSDHSAKSPIAGAFER
jgi:hypothetical protein